VFRSALAAEEPREFCVACHAPNRSSAASSPTHAGIGCRECHVGIELDASGEGHTHVTVAGSAGTVKSCATCHEFSFPGARQHEEKLQLTASEHDQSSFARVACAACHMPRVGGWFSSHHSHAFAEARDEAQLRGALRTSVERPDASHVSLTLSAHDVGHAFPTGDLFRRLVVEAEVIGPDYAFLGERRRDLARHFTDLPGLDRRHGERVATADDRVPADGAQRVDFDFGDVARGRTIAWQVRYERVLHLNPTHEADAEVESSVLLDRGQLADRP
jgi:hypothetical protein